MPKNGLSHPSHLIILTTAPTGLGHLRVTSALMKGLSPDIHSFVLGATDKALNYLHQISSINPLFLQIQNFVQYQPFAEQAFTKNYRNYLRSNSEDIYYQLQTLLTSHQPSIKTALIVATHFCLAHQIAEIKEKLQVKTGIIIKLLVIVTDDTFQKIWAVDGADYLLVPSQFIQKKYIHYFNQQNLAKPKILVNPYPISPLLNEKKDYFISKRKSQLNPISKTPTQILIPISGAAVQLDYLKTIIECLVKEEIKPFVPTVVVKKAPFTQSFIHILNMFSQVKTIISTTNQEAVASYEMAFQGDTFPSLEITKPSEQTFKALVSPRRRGGVIFLFTQPVGKQEFDNLAFLHRHHLLPNETEQEILDKLLNQRNYILPSIIFRKTKQWRGLLLPKNPTQAAKFIILCRKYGIFQTMLAYKRASNNELKGDGVTRFWHIATAELESKATKNHR